MSSLYIYNTICKYIYIYTYIYIYVCILLIVYNDSVYSTILPCEKLGPIPIAQPPQALQCATREGSKRELELNSNLFGTRVGSFRNLGVPYLGVLIIRNLLFRVLH